MHRSPDRFHEKTAVATAAFRACRARIWVAGANFAKPSHCSEIATIWLQMG